jgi:hypothetical protein
VPTQNRPSTVIIMRAYVFSDNIIIMDSLIRRLYPRRLSRRKKDTRVLQLTPQQREKHTTKRGRKKTMSSTDPFSPTSSPKPSDSASGSGRVATATSAPSLRTFARAIFIGFKRGGAKCRRLAHLHLSASSQN